MILKVTQHKGTENSGCEKKPKKISDIQNWKFQFWQIKGPETFQN